MCPVVLVLSAVLCQVQAQRPRDATELLTKVVNAARSAKSWRVEGHVTDVDGRVSAFHLAWRAPDLTRYESEVESGHTLTVCNGTAIWTYHSNQNRYQKLARKVGDHSDAAYRYWISRCGFDVWQWRDRLKGISSAAFVGHDTVESGGHSRGCENVRAIYPMKLKRTHRSGQSIVTMCIDTDRLEILREKRELDYPASANMPAIHQASTSTYGLIERNPDLDSGLFVLTPPPGATDRNLPQTLQDK